jgi:hypothetical protein
VQESTTFCEFLNSLAYPIYIDGIPFTKKQVKRKEPSWFWTPSRKKAFVFGRVRMITLWRLQNSEEYELLPFYQKYFKTRDYLNSGKSEDYPKIPKEIIASNRASRAMRNLILGGKISNV